MKSDRRRFALGAVSPGPAFRCAVVLLLLLVVMAGPAESHAVLLETRPADGAVVDRPPDEIVLRFNELVSPIRIRVTGPDGEAVADEKHTRAEEHTLIITPPAQFREGTHFVSFRVRSLDLHPVSGTTAFSVGQRTAHETPVARTGPYEPLWRIIEVTSRVLQILGIFVTVGGVLYLLLIERRSTPPELLRRGFVWCGLIAIAALVMETGAHGAVLIGAQPGELLASEPWRLGLLEGRGVRATLIAGALAFSLAGLYAPPGFVRTGLYLAAAMTAIASFAAAGHVITTPPKWMTTSAVLIHAGCVLFWAGSLLPLLHRLNQADREHAVECLTRFSSIAVPAVVMLIACGTVMVWALFDTLRDFVTTRYGMILLGKLGLVVVLLAIATVNKRVITPQVAADRPGAIRRLKRNIRIECVLIVAILSVTVVMAQSPPPRALAQAGAHDHEHHHHHTAAEGRDRTLQAEAAGYRAWITFERPETDSVMILARVVNEDGRLVEPLEIALVLASPTHGVGPLRREMQSVGAGHFIHHSPEIALGGRWDITLRVLISDFERISFHTEADFPQ